MKELQLPLIRAESPDDQWIEVDDPRAYPEGEFVALVVWPCPVGRWARGGIGGQAFTACATCGYMSASTAIGHHDGPMLTPVKAYTAEVNEKAIVVFRRMFSGEFEVTA